MFLQLVGKSELLAAKRFETWSRSARASDFSAKQLALDLVNKELITRWQAKMLLRGNHRLMLGNYVLRERIEKSDLGDRFDAVHKQLSRSVKIQYLPAEFCSSATARRAVFELAGNLMKLDHPNLIHVLDVDEENGRIFLVSEATPGVTLATDGNSQLDMSQRTSVSSRCA